ncbi:G3E family GTPase [Bradyrhizobium elkanii]
MGQREASLPTEDKRTIVELLVDQIEFADIIVLNKISAAVSEQRHTAYSVIRGLNAGARLIEADLGRVDLKDLMGVGLFDADKASSHPLWKKELEGFNDHVPETEEYGISGLVYRARRPFDPILFSDFIQSPWKGILRAKGFFWLATRPRWVGELSHCGALVRTTGRSWWWSAVQRALWPSDLTWRKELESSWDPRYGDRKQELVFIGVDFDPDAVRAKLDTCLTESEPSQDPMELVDEADCFPVWRAKGDVHEPA